MSTFDWKKTLAAVAPALATALGGPMAGVAVGMATKALGIEGDEDALAVAVASGDPSILVKLKEVDNTFKLEMERLSVDLERIHQGDRVSARELAKVDMRPQIALSVVFIGGYFAAMFVLHGVLFETKDINGQLMALFGSLIGVFTRELSGIMQFWFGSSAGSQKKTGELVNAARNG